MAYFTPYIDSAGLHIPRYTDIRDQLIEEAKSIFGSDIYVDIDSADYQFISVCALKTYDALQAALLGNEAVTAGDRFFDTRDVRLAEVGNFSAIEGVDAVDRAHQLGAAGTDQAAEAEDLAAADLERDVLELAFGT